MDEEPIVPGILPDVRKIIDPVLQGLFATIDCSGVKYEVVPHRCLFVGNNRDRASLYCCS